MREISGLRLADQFAIDHTSLDRTQDAPIGQISFQGWPTCEGLSTGLHPPRRVSKHHRANHRNRFIAPTPGGPQRASSSSGCCRRENKTPACSTMVVIGPSFGRLAEMSCLTSKLFPAGCRDFQPSTLLLLLSDSHIHSVHHAAASASRGWSASTCSR